MSVAGRRLRVHVFLFFLFFSFPQRKRNLGVSRPHHTTLSLSLPRLGAAVGGKEQGRPGAVLPQGQPQVAAHARRGKRGRRPVEIIGDGEAAERGQQCAVDASLHRGRVATGRGPGRRLPLERRHVNRLGRQVGPGAAAREARRRAHLHVRRERRRQRGRQGGLGARVGGHGVEGGSGRRAAKPPGVPERGAGARRPSSLALATAVAPLSICAVGQVTLKNQGRGLRAPASLPTPPRAPLLPFRRPRPRCRPPSRSAGTAARPRGTRGKPPS